MAKEGKGKLVDLSGGVGAPEGELGSVEVLKEHGLGFCAHEGAESAVVHGLGGEVEGNVLFPGAREGDEQTEGGRLRHGDGLSFLEWGSVSLSLNQPTTRYYTDRSVDARENCSSVSILCYSLRGSGVCRWVRLRGSEAHGDGGPGRGLSDRSLGWFSSPRSSTSGGSLLALLARPSCHRTRRVRFLS